jgi:transposase
MAKRVNNEAIRALAERMYVEEGMTAKAIAEALDTTPQTIGRWKQGIQGGRDWDELRTEFLSAPNNVKKVLMDELTKLSKGHESTLDIKAIKECVLLIGTLSEKVSAQMVMTVFREFDTWVATQDPEIAISFLEWHKTFLLYKAQQEV